MGSLRIGGLTPLTSIDFPGRLAAVVFCQGCPWRCGYCHNAHLIPARGTDLLPWNQVMDFLADRRGLLDGVVFSGGEPTLQASLPDAVREVRAMGFQAALHTAGMYPERLASVLPLMDWIGLDIKGPAHCYDAITGTPGGGSRVMASLDLVVASGVDYECRTTWDPALFSEDELDDLVGTLAARGVRHWALQPRGTAGRPCVAAADIAHRLKAAYPHISMRLPAA